MGEILEKTTRKIAQKLKLVKSNARFFAWGKEEFPLLVE